jgi:hypothetical protein
MCTLSLKKPYLRTWGIYPGDDRGKMSIPIQEVLKVEDSPAKLHLSNVSRREAVN